jgi:hypothetical protein
MELPVVHNGVTMVNIKKTACQALTTPLFACFWIGSKSTMSSYPDIFKPRQHWPDAVPTPPG